MTSTLYHWTPMESVPSILDYGLNPELSRGRTARIWLCSRRVWLRVRCHVARHHGIEESRLALIRVKIDGSLLRRGRMRGTYYVLGAVDHEYVAWVPFASDQRNHGLRRVAGRNAVRAPPAPLVVARCGARVSE